MPIQLTTPLRGLARIKAVFAKNRRHYVQEALGLAIFMLAACFFGAELFSSRGFLFNLIPDPLVRQLVMGLMMGLTALVIFYSPWTSPSGSQINPAVTLSFLMLGRMCRYDAVFYILFQFAGATAATLGMSWLMGPILTDSPVNTVVTVPGPGGWLPALTTELSIAFITMLAVLLLTGHSILKRYTRLISAGLVCTWVLIAGPVSGFGMNPARSFASALTAGIWTHFWIYLLAPVAAMLFATVVYRRILAIRAEKDKRVFVRVVKKTKELIEPLEYLL